MANQITVPAISISILAALLLAAGSDGPFIVEASLSRLNASFVSNPSTEQLCAQSSEPAFCRTILTDDLRTKNVSTLKLGLVTVDVALNKSYSTEAKIHALSLSTDDPKLNNSLALCEMYYEVALNNLRGLTGFFNNRQMVTAMQASITVKICASSCEKKLNNPPVKSPLAKENQDLERLGDIIAAAANILNGQSESFPPQVSVSSPAVSFLFYLPLVLLLCSLNFSTM